VLRTRVVLVSVAVVMTVVVVLLLGRLLDNRRLGGSELQTDMRIERSCHFATRGRLLFGRRGESGE
jgi:hypothetical protein